MARNPSWYGPMGILFATTIVAMGTSSLWAQAVTATILGSVADTSGAAVPDAQVQVRNTGTGITQSAVTDWAGRYRVTDLGIGEYEVQAAKQGFQTVVRKGITLTVGSEIVVDVSLPVGQRFRAEQPGRPERVRKP